MPQRARPAGPLPLNPSHPWRATSDGAESSRQHQFDCPLDPIDAVRGVRDPPGAVGSCDSVGAAPALPQRIEAETDHFDHEPRWCTHSVGGKTNKQQRTDFIGGSWASPTATPAARREIWTAPSRPASSSGCSMTRASMRRCVQTRRCPSGGSQRTNLLRRMGGLRYLTGSSAALRARTCSKPLAVFSVVGWAGPSTRWSDVASAQPRRICLA
jgi:hypothetical protein